jgi:hypothetical protein
MTPSLIKEWETFRLRARKELEIGPWITRYVRRCVCVAGENGQAIRLIEKGFLKREISEKAYAELIRSHTT